MSSWDMKTSVDRITVGVLRRLDRFHQRYFFKKREWPVATGRYCVGNKNSVVAIRTLGNVDLMLDIGSRQDVAIVGKTFTENLGIEKMIRNIVTNPAIRFLILCGNETPHRVGQSVQALMANGVDCDGRIVESKGRLPQLTNVSREEIERFRHQLETMDLIGVHDVGTILACVEDLGRRNPDPFEEPIIAGRWGAKLEIETVKCWHRESLDYQADPAGFFIIQVDSDTHEIVVEHYSTEFKILRQLRGETALCVYSTIIRSGWVSLMGHTAYLGRELCKAELALEHGCTYEQNKNLMWNHDRERP